MSVVVVLEVIQVEYHGRQRTIVAEDAVELPVKFLGEHPSVEQACEIVSARPALQSAQENFSVDRYRSLSCEHGEECSRAIGRLACASTPGDCEHAHGVPVE
jgi:hypothetical protein